MRSELGKIQKAEVGHGGYQDAMVGITFTLGGEGWGVGDFWGQWYMLPDENTKWTRESQLTKLGEVFWRINLLLKDAKVSSVTDLEGVPVRVFFNGNTLDRWEVLKEVI